MTTAKKTPPQNMAIHDVDSLFRAEKTYSRSLCEQCLPTENELQQLMGLVLTLVKPDLWPDDPQFDNELRDRLQYSFREKFLAVSTERGKTYLDHERPKFILQEGREMVIATFHQVLKEYNAASTAKCYWGEPIGYFS